MPTVVEYHRPRSVESAVAVLAADSRRQILAGGTLMVPAARQATTDGVELVDLQGLGLDTIDAGSASVTIGAMVRLGEIAEAETVPSLVRSAARRELPSALRNQATLGGTIGAAESTSCLLAALLVHGAEVTVEATEQVALDTYLENGDRRLITGVTIEAGGSGRIEATGRTPADEPIVAAVARRGDDGIRLALTGVDARPVLADPADPCRGLAPPSDFRGSAEYRLHLAETLSRRVSEGLA